MGGGEMKHLALAAAVAVACSPGVAAAQNHSLAPSGGRVSLSSGFTNDPRTFAVRAGGPIDIEELGGDCAGFVANAPSLQLSYEADDFPLAFRSRSESDTVLAVRSPSGRWSCDDDGWNDLNAEVLYDAPESGAYHVWVGTFSEADPVAAELLITEVPDSGDDEDDFWSEPASTTVDIQVCNESGWEAKVAVSYIEVGSDRFVNRGWYPVASGACSTVAVTDNSNFYLYAETDDGSARTWTGGHSLCVEYPGPYTFYSTGEEYCQAHQELRHFSALSAGEPGTYTWRLQP